MLHYMKLQNAPFEKIKSGKKDIEMRLYDEKRSKIKKGDTIEFTNQINEEKLIVEVIDMHLFKNFNELYLNFDKTRIGYEENEISLPEDMQQYYSKEEIEKYGVVGIEMKYKQIKREGDKII